MSESRKTSYYVAVVEALFVTVLWSSSWVIIKFGLSDIPPITFSGLRYSLASLILLGVIASNKQYRDELKGRERSWWTTLVSYGVIFVAVTQGAQFVALSLLEAITVSTLLNLTPLVVLVLGVLILQEVPSRHQVAWILVGISGEVYLVRRCYEGSFRNQRIRQTILLSGRVLRHVSYATGNILYWVWGPCWYAETIELCSAHDNIHHAGW